MDVVHPRVAGIDVHKKVVWVAVRLPGEAAGERKVFVKSFRTPGHPDPTWRRQRATSPGRLTHPNSPAGHQAGSAGAAARQLCPQVSLQAPLQDRAPEGWHPHAARAPALTRCGGEPERSAAEIGCAPTPPRPGRCRRSRNSPAVSG